MTYPQLDLHSRTGDWLLETVQRRPEALLLMAAGCALLMRSGRPGVGSVAARMASSGPGRHESNPKPVRSASSTLGEGLERTADAVSQYVGDVADNVGSSARAYASNVADGMSDYADAARRTASDYADGAMRNISQTSDQMREHAETAYETASEAIREQPLLIAALGLAAGAAVAALFPATAVERRTLGAASDALAGSAAEVGENLLGAAGKAGERLRATVAEHGLDSKGLTDMAREVGGTLTAAVMGKAEDDRGRPGQGTQPLHGAGGQKTGPTEAANVPGVARPATSDLGGRPGPKSIEPAGRSSGNVPSRS